MLKFLVFIVTFGPMVDIWIIKIVLYFGLSDWYA